MASKCLKHLQSFTNSKQQISCSGAYKLFIPIYQKKYCKQNFLVIYTLFIYCVLYIYKNLLNSMQQFKRHCANHIQYTAKMAKILCCICYKLIKVIQVI